MPNSPWWGSWIVNPVLKLGKYGKTLSSGMILDVHHFPTISPSFFQIFPIPGTAPGYASHPSRAANRTSWAVAPCVATSSPWSGLRRTRRCGSGSPGCRCLEASLQWRKAPRRSLMITYNVCHLFAWASRVVKKKICCLQTVLFFWDGIGYGKWRWRNTGPGTRQIGPGGIFSMATTPSAVGLEYGNTCHAWEHLTV